MFGTEDWCREPNRLEGIDVDLRSNNRDIIRASDAHKTLHMVLYCLRRRSASVMTIVARLSLERSSCQRVLVRRL